MSESVGKVGESRADADIGNVKNRTIFQGDNLDVMRGMNDACVDLIYLDPPFNSDRNHEALPSSKAKGARFKDIWRLTDVKKDDLEWLAERYPVLHTLCEAAQKTYGDSMYAYLSVMAPRLIEMRRLLRPTGSIYLHCDDVADGYLRMLMDSLFGAGNRLNTITWKRSSGRNMGRKWGRVHDTILHYGMPGYTWNPQYEPLSGGGLRAYCHEDERGRYQLTDVGAPMASGYFYELGMEEVMPKRGYRMPEETARRWLDEGRLVVRSPKLDEYGEIEKRYVPRYKRYLSESEGVKMGDVWTDIGPLQGGSKEYLDYRTQKPEALLTRIIEASSNPGDAVLDPFCGCATACVVAEKLDRRWVGIDLSAMAVQLVKERFIDFHGLIAPARATVHRMDQPKRTDLGKLPKPRVYKNEMYGEQNGCCKECKVKFDIDDLEIDHVVAVAKGGTDHRENLQLLCRRCNSDKGTGTPGEHKEKRRRREGRRR